MPRRLRKDFPGVWHHLWNRGISKRTLFETPKDVRTFLSFLARQVRVGDLEVHAYAILTTHFHLLSRSPRGRLSAAMQRTQDCYARWFNRSRRRDGPLFRGRFGNRIVDSEGYWWTLLRYIDRNPVEAGLCPRPRDFPFGSAAHYCRAAGPAWLCRDEVERAMGRRAGEPWDPCVYVAFSDESLTPGQRWVAERRALSRNEAGGSPLDDLLPAAPDRARKWMEARAELADGTRPGCVMVAPATVQALVEARRRGAPGPSVEVGRKSVDLWDLLEAGALRDHCGLTLREVQVDTGTAPSTVQIRVALHHRALATQPAHREEAARLLAAALDVDHPGTLRMRGGPVGSEGRRSPKIAVPGRRAAIPG